MVGYKNFASDVRTVFDLEFQNNYKLSIQKEEDSSVFFSSEFCTLVIYLDGLILDACFMEFGKTFLDNEYYSVSTLMECKNIKHKNLNIQSSNADVIRQLKELKDMILQNFNSTLKNGDFRWKHDYKNFINKRAQDVYGDFFEG